MKFLNPIEISKLERDKILPNPEDLVFYSKTISKSPQGPQESSPEIPYSTVLPPLDKSKHIFEDRFSKTNHPANTKKATFPGKHVVEDKDKLLVFEGNLEKIPAPENKNLNG